MLLTGSEAKVLYQCAKAQPIYGRNLLVSLLKTDDLPSSEYKNAMSCIGGARETTSLSVARAREYLYAKIEAAQKKG